MTVEEFIRNITWAVYIVIFLDVLWRAVRQPLRANIDIALFFGASALVIALSLVVGSIPDLPASAELIAAVNGTSIMALAYLITRLVDDFTIVPSWLLRAAFWGWIVLSLPLFVSPLRGLGWLTLLQVAYLVGLQVYAALMFIRESRRSSGVTRRRMQAVATGSIFLGVNFVASGMRVALPGLSDLWGAITQIAGLGSAISYFLGFAPPAFLRRAWQEPELRAFLGRAATLPRLPDTDAIRLELERGAAASTGSRNATIGLWDRDGGVLNFELGDQVIAYTPEPGLPVGRAFLQQVPVFSADITLDNPDYAETSRAMGATAVLAAPITAGAKRLGVLAVYAPRAPIFALDDLELVKLLADQAAVILESRALIDEAARVRAREEATRLKDDFLSSAAHDLKTPLTTLVGQAQLLERQALRNPEAPASLEGIRRMEREAQRLRRLVTELLDASRAEQGMLVGLREEIDLAEVVRESCAHSYGSSPRCNVELAGPLIGEFDRIRMAQLIENLLENAIKYSPDGDSVTVRGWSDNGIVRLDVSDRGIGIPASDLPHIFDRFYRANNVNDRSFSGMGLGLFICRGIVDQHGGKISVTSQPRVGTTFHIALPTRVNDPIVSVPDLPEGSMAPP